MEFLHVQGKDTSFNTHMQSIQDTSPTGIKLGQQLVQMKDNHEHVSLQRKD